MPQVVLTLLVAALTTTAALSSRRVGSRWVVVVFALAVVGSALIAAFVASAYPWSNALVLTSAWSGGVLYGRSPPTWFWGLLAVMSVLDIASFVFAVHAKSDPSGSAGPILLGNLTVLWVSGHFREGVLDIAVLAALVVRWSRQWVIGAVIAFVLVASLLPFALVLAGIRGGLPLLPFSLMIGVLSVALLHLPSLKRWQKTAANPE